MCDGVAARLVERDFTDSLNTWLAVLGKAKFATFMCDGVAARLVERDFTDSLNTWLAVLGKAKFATFVCDGVAKRLGDPAFDAFLERNLDRMTHSKFVAIIRKISARFRILDDFMDFYATCPRWTRKMSEALCKAVPKDQTEQVPPSVYMGIANTL